MSQSNTASIRKVQPKQWKTVAEHSARGRLEALYSDDPRKEKGAARAPILR